MDFFHLHVVPSGIGLQYCKIQYSNFCAFNKTYRLIYPSKTHLNDWRKDLFLIDSDTGSICKSFWRTDPKFLSNVTPLRANLPSSLVLWLGLSVIIDTYCQGTCTKLPPQSSFGAEWRDQWRIILHGLCICFKTYLGEVLYEKD